MGLLDFLFKREPKTLAEQISELHQKKKNIEAKLNDSQLMLDRERKKSNPDVLRIDRYEREVAVWAQQKEKVDEAIAKLQ
jgi:hypothetical protein